MSKAEPPAATRLLLASPRKAVAVCLLFAVPLEKSASRTKPNGGGRERDREKEIQSLWSPSLQSSLYTTSSLPSHAPPPRFSLLFTSPQIIPQPQVDYKAFPETAADVFPSCHLLNRGPEMPRGRWTGGWERSLFSQVFDVRKTQFELIWKSFWLNAATFSFQGGTLLAFMHHPVFTCFHAGAFF